MRNELVSIVMPAFNAAEHIAASIESVLAQTYTEWELIVIDDCSTDETADVVKRLMENEERIRLYRLDQNSGAPAGPRNFGIRHTKGRWVAFLDSDDIWHPRKLAIQLSVLGETGARFCCSRMTNFRDAGVVQFGDVSAVCWRKISYWQQSLRAQIPTSSVIVEKQMLLSELFVEDLDYKAVEDYHCWLRLLSKDDCVKISQPLLFYRVVEGQISGSKLYMMGRVFFVHKNLPGRSLLAALFLTATHVFGGVYFRMLKKGM